MSAFKNTYLMIKGFLKLCKELKGVDIAPTNERLINTLSHNEHGSINVYHIPDINKLGYRFGALLKNAISKEEYIAVDDEFLTLEKDIQDAIIGHELGHFIFGHLNMSNKEMAQMLTASYKAVGANNGNALTTKANAERRIQQEFEADEYAVQYAGIDAVLKELSFLYSLPYVNHSEIKARYENIVMKL